MGPIGPRKPIPLARYTPLHARRASAEVASDWRPAVSTIMRTMRSAILRRPATLFGLSALTIATACIVIARSRAFAANPDVAAWGITFDLAVSIPLLYWFFVIRSGHARPCCAQAAMRVFPSAIILQAPRLCRAT